MTGTAARGVLAIAILVGGSATRAADPGTPAEKIAAGIRRAGFQRVVVLPLVIEEDLGAEQIARHNGGAAPAAPSSSAALLSASFHSRLLPERMEMALAEAAAGDFSLVPCATLLAALERGGRAPGSRGIGEAEVAGLVAGQGTNAEGLVVGSLKTRFGEAAGPQGQVLGFSLEDVAWKLVDLRDSTIRAAASTTAFTSLADAVYRGRSAEFFRWDGERLRVLFAFGQHQKERIPLAPSDGNDLSARLEANDHINPIINPNCPYKVRFEFDGKPRALTIPVDRNPSKIVGGPSKTFADWGGHVFLPIEPGETPVIKLTNDGAKRVMVALFVDGVNVLGKRRELPDERCATWVLDAKKEGTFRGWYTGPRGEEQVEPFVLEPWQRSIAGKLGLERDADQAQAITIVVFTEGWPDREKLAFFDRDWTQSLFWDGGRRQLVVKEGVLSPGGFGAAPDVFGMGGLAPQPGKLAWVKGQPQGTILAAMTVWYGPQGEMRRIMERRLKGIVGFGGPWVAVTTVPPSAAGAR